MRNIAEVTTAVANGDLSKKITVDVRGEVLELKNTINTMVDQLNAFASEVTRVAREVGTEGKLGGQAVVRGVGGTWKDLTDNVNLMASNLTGQVRNIAEVTTAVANGDLSKKITVDVKGEILELKITINTMVDQLNSFAAEERGAALARRLERDLQDFPARDIRVRMERPVGIAGNDLVPVQELEPRTEDLLRHAVDAAEVAAVGDRDPQVSDQAAVAVAQRIDIHRTKGTLSAASA